MKKISLEKFLERAKKKFGDLFDYSKIEYIDFNTPICIICPIHGEFWQTPKQHLINHGCPKCSNRTKLTKEEFIARAKKVHGDKYDYSQVNYINNKTKVCIICPKHGEFWQKPNNHLLGEGCSKCKGEKITRIQTLNTELFIKKSKQIHGDKYNYYKTIYQKSNQKVCITCDKHGDFFQTPNNHLHGYGCPKCKMSHLEREVYFLLQKENIDFQYNQYFPFLENLQLDFYIPSKKIAIECQGKQHFGLGGWTQNISKKEKEFLETQTRDKLKKELCEKNGIKLLYYSNLHINYPYKVYENIDDILQNILST